MTGSFLDVIGVYVCERLVIWLAPEFGSHSSKGARAKPRLLTHRSYYVTPSFGRKADYGVHEKQNLKLFFIQYSHLLAGQAFLIDWRTFNQQRRRCGGKVYYTERLRPMLIGRTKQTQYMYSEELTTFLSPTTSNA